MIGRLVTPKLVKFINNMKDWEKLDILMCPEYMTEGRNELLNEVMISIPNIAEQKYTIMFSGWRIELFPDGKYKVIDTGGILKNKH